MIASNLVNFVNAWKNVEIPNDAVVEIQRLKYRQMQIERRLLMLDYPTDPQMFAVYKVEEPRKTK